MMSTQVRSRLPFIVISIAIGLTILLALSVFPQQGTNILGTLTAPPNPHIVRTVNNENFLPNMVLSHGESRYIPKNIHTFITCPASPLPPGYRWSTPQEYASSHLLMYEFSPDADQEKSIMNQDWPGLRYGYASFEDTLGSLRSDRTYYVYASEEIFSFQCSRQVNDSCTNIYFADALNNALHVIGTDGITVQDIPLEIPATERLSASAVDLERNTLYWGHKNTVYKSSLLTGETAFVALLPNAAVIREIHADPRLDMLHIHAAEVDPSGSPTGNELAYEIRNASASATAHEMGQGFRAVDAKNRIGYMLTKNANSMELRAVHLDTFTENVLYSLSETTGLTVQRVAASEGKVYWLNVPLIEPSALKPTFWRMDSEGGDPEQLFAIHSPKNAIRSFTTDGINEKVYWTQQQSNISRVYRANMDGSEAEQVFSGQSWIFSVQAIDSCWSSAVNPVVHADEIWARFSGTTIMLGSASDPSMRKYDFSDLMGGFAVKELTIDTLNQRMFWLSENDYLFGAYLDGSDAFVISHGPLIQETSITVDPVGKRLYSTQRDTRIVSRAYDATEFRVEYETGNALLFVSELVADGPGRKIFFIEALPPPGRQEAIGILDLNGGSKRTLPGSASNFPLSYLTVDSEEERLYWKNGRLATYVDLATESPIETLDIPDGAAFAVRGDLFHWLDWHYRLWQGKILAGKVLERIMVLDESFARFPAVAIGQVQHVSRSTELSVELSAPDFTVPTRSDEYRIILKNTGDYVALNPKITLEIPDTVTPINPCPSTQNAQGRTQMTCDLSILGAQQESVITFIMNASADTSCDSPLSFLLRAEADNATTQSSVVEVPMECQQLELAVNGPSQLTHETNILYSFSLRNNGPKTTNETRVVNYIPDQLEFLPEESAAECVVGSLAGSRVLTCTYDSLSPLEQITSVLHFRVRYHRDVYPCGEIQNPFVAEAADAPPVESVHITNLLCPAEPDLRISAFQGPALQGLNQLETYSYTIENRGGRVANNVIVSVSYPADGVTRVLPAHCKGVNWMGQGPRKIECTIGDVFPAQPRSGTIEFELLYCASPWNNSSVFPLHIQVASDEAYPLQGVSTRRIHDGRQLSGTEWVCNGQ